MSILAAGATSGGTHVLLAFAGIVAFCGFVSWAFEQATSWLLLALVVGVLMVAGSHHHSPGHPRAGGQRRDRPSCAR
jgi:hypothetical protein